MRRRVVGRGVLVLVLGALTSIAIAEVFHYSRIGRSPPPSADGLAVIDGREWWVTVLEGSGWEGAVAVEARYVGRDPRMAARLDTSIMPAWARPYLTHPQTGASAAGWPWYCLRGCGYTNMRGANEGHYDGMVQVPMSKNGFPVRLLTHVYGPGLAADTALFSLGWAMLVVGAPAAQRWWRHSRRRCQACGYDLNGQLEVGCPECGWQRA